VQIRHTADVSHGFGRRLAAADEEVVVAAVRAWMWEMVADAAILEDGPDGSPGT
jgi:hypothetical protein